MLCLTRRPAAVCCSCWFFGQCGLCVFARLFHHPCRLSNLFLHGKKYVSRHFTHKGLRKVMTTTLGRVKLHIFKGGVKLASVVEKGSTRRHFDFIKKSLREKFTPHEAERSFRYISMLRPLPRFWQGSATVTFHGGDFVPALFLIPFDISPISTRTGMVKTFFPAAVHKFCLQIAAALRQHSSRVVCLSCPSLRVSRVGRPGSSLASE